MFTIEKNDSKGVPILVWLESPEQLDEECLRQATNLSNLPFAYQHIALMADAHKGYGMPIGGLLAAKEAVIPNAVGVDIGCGVVFTETNWAVEEIDEKILKSLVRGIMERIPTGFEKHKKKKKCRALDLFSPQESPSDNLKKEIAEGYYQVGTLGGGNHFIELQSDDKGKLCIMIHSGSRNFGFKVAQHFNRLAKKLNEKKYTGVPKSYDLAYLPAASTEGKDYLLWMNLALDFAAENRTAMLEVVKEEARKECSGIKFGKIVNAHHNYASQEEHYGEKVWVHRKGAIKTAEGELGIIPGAMGAKSYIVKGLGNDKSFCSSPHGAGRRLGRKEAVRTINIEETINDLKSKGIILGKRKKKDVSEESRFAYKDIDWVIDQSADLAVPIKALNTLAVVKG